jgi:hypothetical protein
MADSPEMTPPPVPGVHAATASALASLFGALPAALLGEYKTAGIVASGLAILFYALAAWAKFQDSMKSKDRKLVVRIAVIALVVVSWSITGWSEYRLRHTTPQAVSQPAPASAGQTTSPAPAATPSATADPPAGTTVNNIQNSGTANPIITGGSGSVYIGDSVQADRGGKSNAKHR